MASIKNNLTGEQIKALLEDSLTAQCCNLKNYIIIASGDNVDIFPPEGHDTIHCINDIFNFADAFGMSAYISIEYNPCCRPYIRLC